MVPRKEPKVEPKIELKMEDLVPAPAPPSLAEIVARRDTAAVDIEMSLTDAVDALVCSGRTAAVPWWWGDGEILLMLRESL